MLATENIHTFFSPPSQLGLSQFICKPLCDASQLGRFKGKSLTHARQTLYDLAKPPALYKYSKHLENVPEFLFS